MKKNFSYYLRKIIYTIINFLKMLFLYLFKFISIFFPERKKEKARHEIKKEIEREKRKKTRNFILETLPDEENKKETPSSILKEEKRTLINNIFTLKEIDEIINKVLKEEFEVDIKKITKDEEKEIEKLKERILPILIHNIEYKNIKTKDKLETNTTKVIKEELVKKPLLIKSNKRTKKEYNIFFPNNMVPEENTEMEKKEEEEKGEKQKNLQEESLISSTTIKKEPFLNLNSEVTNRITSSTLVITSIAKEIKKEEKPISSVEKKEVVEEANSFVPTEEQKEKENFLEELTLKKQIELIEIVNKEDLTIEQIIDIEQKINNKEQKKEEPQETKIKDEINKPFLEVPTFEQTMEEVENNSLEEIEKEDIEEKDYKGLEEQINKMLSEIELFCIKNEGKLTEEQLAKLQTEKEQLHHLKEKLQREREQDIKKDEKLFTTPVQKEEKNGLLKYLRELQLEHQTDLTEETLNQIEDLDKMDKKKGDLIEKRLIKKKLKKAVYAANIASLPFIKNRFFFAFALGLFVNKNLGFLNSIITRTTKDFDFPKLEGITNGQSAIEEAINTNYNNLEMLNYLNGQAILKHPELKGDAEYKYYTTHLNTRLNKNYNKLTKKYNNLEKYHKKPIKNIKILKNQEKRTSQKDV